MIKVLIVEDDENLRKLLGFYLAKPGYKISLAENGKKAIAILKTEKMNIVITDYRMPKMNGLELLDFLKRNQSSIPTIMMSGDDRKEEAFKNGAIGFLPKDDTDFLKNLRDLLQKTESVYCK